MDEEYLNTLRLFGDSKASAFSIHDLLEAEMFMALLLAHGDEDGERSEALVLSIEDATITCPEFSTGQEDWTPILFFVSLVLGLKKVNSRYISSLHTTFTYPQSLGMLGGKPGTSTCIVGVQVDNAFYLDPCEVQSLMLVDMMWRLILPHNTASDFDELCSLATKLANDSNGAALFTVACSRKLPKQVNHEGMINDGGQVPDYESQWCHTH